MIIIWTPKIAQQRNQALIGMNAITWVRSEAAVVTFKPQWAYRGTKLL